MKILIKVSCVNKKLRILHKRILSKNLLVNLQVCGQAIERYFNRFENEKDIEELVSIVNKITSSELTNKLTDKQVREVVDNSIAEYYK